MFDAIRGARGFHAVEDAPAQREASVARPKVPESGARLIAPGVAPTTELEVVAVVSGASGDSLTARPGADPHDVEAAVLLQSVLRATSATYADLGRAIGKSEQFARMLCLPEHGRTLGLGRFLRLRVSGPVGTKIHDELVRRLAVANDQRSPISTGSFVGDMTAAVGVCGAFVTTIAQILSGGATREGVPNGRRALREARQTLDRVEQALDAAERGWR